MKILHYIPSIDETSGGVGAYMQLLTLGLGKLCELHVATISSDNERVLDDCKVHYLPKRWFPTSELKRAFINLLDEIKPDVVHVNCCWMPPSALIAIWAKNSGMKVVYSPHGMLEPWILNRHYLTRKLPAIWLYQRKGIECADVIHATAESEKDNLRALGWNGNVCVIGNCVDVDSIGMKCSWKRKKNILFLSRVHVKKGINFLIEAVAELKDELAGYRVVIAGPCDDGYIDELKTLANKSGVAEIVTFEGAVFGERKYDLYREADVFVLPTHSENFGIVVTEALACGTPVITTVGTPWRELEDYGCGWWTEIGTQPTVNALKEFLSLSETEIERMGRNGRRLVEEKFSCQKIAKDFITMYEELV